MGRRRPHGATAPGVLVNLSALGAGFDVASEDLYCSACNLRGVVVGIGADADGADDRDPARYGAGGGTVGHPHADSPGHGSQDPDRGLLDEISLADAHHEVANGL